MCIDFIAMKSCYTRKFVTCTRQSICNKAGGRRNCPNTMEAQAPYSLSATPPVADLRELVAPVAAWLAALGFQHIECGPVPGVEESEIMAGWESPSGALFHLMLVARPTMARCELARLAEGRLTRCFTWTQVQHASQVYFLVEQNMQFQRARAEVPSVADAAPVAANPLAAIAAAPPAPGPSVPAGLAAAPGAASAPVGPAE
jgi:hypothetical protein